jgi:hypothetical protein
LSSTITRINPMFKPKPAQKNTILKSLTTAK